MSLGVEFSPIPTLRIPAKSNIDFQEWLNFRLRVQEGGIDLIIANIPSLQRVCRAIRTEPLCECVNPIFTAEGVLVAKAILAIHCELLKS